MHRFVIEILGSERKWRFPARGGSPRLIYQAEPNGLFRVDRRPFPMRPGDILVLRDGEITGAGEGRFLHIAFPPEVLAEAPDLFARKGRRGRRPNAVSVHIAKRDRESLENILVVLLRERDDRLPGWETAVRARVLDILTFVCRAQHGSIPHWQQNENVTTMLYRMRVRHVIHHVTESLADRYTLDDLAGMSRLNRTTFSRIHKIITGKSPMRFLASMRMERAQRLLLQTEMPIGEIAAAVGYEDLSTFFRAFRRHAGTTPQAYREQMKGKSLES